MALTVAERIAQCAEQIADDPQFGYSQPNRAGYGSKVIRFSDGTTYTIRGGDLDCSEMVRRCVNAALGRTAIEYMWTGSQDAELTALGFKKLTYNAHPIRGDILWKQGHTGVALGGGRQAEAYIDENGTILGNRSGDQTGGEVRTASLASNWTVIFRYPTTVPDVTTGMIPMKFKYQFDAYTNVRDKPSTKTGKKVSWLDGGDVWEFDGVVLGDGIVWGTYIGPKSKKRLYAAIATIDFGKVVK